MKAIAIHQFGGTDQFETVDIEKPTPNPDEVLIKIVASSINPLDYKLRNGDMPDLITHFPMILQGDVAGVIEQVGDKVIDFKVGDEVYGCVGGLLNMAGGLAEYVATDPELISLKPSSLSMKEAAALPLIAETAWEGLVNKAKVKAGQTVLIHGGTGGVGHFSIMLAKHLGAKVYTTVSTPEKAEIAKKLGADKIINYKQQSVEDYVKHCTDMRGFDVVFDTVGGENLALCMQAVANNGSVISILGAGMHDLTSLFLKNANLHMVLQPLPLITGEKRKAYQTLLKTIAEIVDANKLKPLLDKNTFKLSDVVQAYEHLEQGKAIGKVVLEGW